MNPSQNTYRNYKIRRAVLSRLQGVEPCALPVSQLFVEAHAKVRPVFSEEEFQAVLEWLKNNSYIAVFEEDLSDEPAYFITNTGKIALQK